MPTSIFPTIEVTEPARSSEGPDTVETTRVQYSEPGLPAIPGYEVLEEVGRGGMGIVYKARDLKLKRLVAIKMLLDPEFASPEQRMRFKIEAEAVAQLKHPHIVQVYELGELPGSKSSIAHPYMVLEYVEGPTLRRAMRQHPLTERQSAALIVTLSRAMQHAHDHGLIHRDLKPANILLSAESLVLSPESADAPAHTQHSGLSTQDSGLRTLLNPKITDFGLVKALAREGEARRDLTRTALMVGTPQYMAPEQASPNPSALSCSVDVYSLGVILYELLTQHLPFDDVDVLQMLAQLQNKEPLSPRKHQPRIPVDLETIVLKCLEKDPARRYHSAAALADDLTRFLSHEPIQARPLSEWQRISKWVQRYPTVASLAGMLFAVITTALIVIAILWRRADTDRSEAVEQSVDAGIARDLARGAERVARDAERAALKSDQQSTLALYFSKIAQSDLLLRQGQLLRPLVLLSESGKSKSLAEVRSWEWFHLLRLCSPMTQKMEAADDYVQRIAFHPKLERLFSIEGAEYFGSDPPEKYPGKLLMHEPKPGTNQWHWRTAYNSALPLRDLQLALDGTKALLANVHEEVDMIDIDKLLPASEIKPIPLPRQLKWKLAADAGLVFLWSKKQPGPLVKVFDMKLSKVSETITLPGAVNELVVSDNGEMLFFVLKNHTIGMWHIKKKDVLWKQQLPAGEYRLAVSGNGKQAAYLTHPVGDVVWMEAANARVLAKISDVQCDGIQLSAQGDRLAVNSLTTADHDVLVWRRQLNGDVITLPLTLRGHRGFIRGYEFDPHGDRMLTYGIDGSVRLWDTSLDSPKVGACLQVFRGHAGSVLTVAFDPRGKHIASGGIDANILLWDARSSVDTDLYPVGSGFSGEWISAYSFVEGTSTMAVFDQRNAQLLLLDLPSREVKEKFHLPESFTGFRAPRYDCSFSGNGKLFTVLDKEVQRALLYETLTGKLLWTSPKTEFKILHASLSGNNKRLLISGHFPQPAPERRAVPFKCEYQVWDVEKKELVHRAVLDRFSQGWCMNHDGSRVAAAVQKPGPKYEMAVFLVEENGRELYSVPFNLSKCTSINFSPDGKYLGAVNFHPAENWLTIRDAQTGMELHKKQSVFESTHVTFTPDSKRVLVTGYDSHATMLDPASGHEVLTLKHHGMPRQNDYALSPKLVFSQDGTRLAVHSWDAAITVWHAFDPNTADVTKLIPKNLDERYRSEEMPLPLR